MKARAKKQKRFFPFEASELSEWGSASEASEKSLFFFFPFKASGRERKTFFPLVAYRHSRKKKPRSPREKASGPL